MNIQVTITEQKAYILGVEAAVEHFGQDCDPYTDIERLSHAWNNGWQDWWKGTCNERGIAT